MDFSEGEVKFSAPKGEATKKLPVFYNPEMAFDRELTSAISKNYSGKYCDALAGSGIRGMIAAKNGFEVSLNDASEGAVKLIKENLKANKIKAEVSCEDINLYLRQHRCDKFDVIDVDPFGSFVSSLDSVFRAINRKGGLICLTATDTAPLCGVSINTCQRRYDARPIRTSYAKEVGLRILLGNCARAIAKYEFAIKPVFSYNRRHYFRLFLETERGLSKANKMLKEMSYLQHCFKCDWRDYADVDSFKDKCPNCGNDLEWAGPLWAGDFADPKLKAESDDPKVQKMIDKVKEEQGITAPHYDIHHLCEIRGIPAPKKVLIIENNKGVDTHFSRNGLRCEKVPEF
jgi:tRNA (guanine26-N2/guanine27-N2)-dimethyltransferase